MDKRELKKIYIMYNKYYVYKKSFIRFFHKMSDSRKRSLSFQDGFFF